MKRLVFLLTTLLMTCLMVNNSSFGQGPSGEVIKQPPPVNNASAARAAQAARIRRKAAIDDQVELALKNGNDNMSRHWANQTETSYLKEAESDYQEAAKLKPSDWRAQYALGDVYYWQQRYADSEAALNRAIALHPHDPNSYKLLARSYSNDFVSTPEANVAERQRKLDQQLRAQEGAVAADPSRKNFAAYHDLAETYAYRKQYDKAIATYKKELAILAGGDPKELAEVHYRLGDILEDLERFPEAVAEYKEATRSNPDYWMYFSFLSRACGENNQYREAIAAYEQAKRLNVNADDDAEIARMYAEAGDFDKSIALLRELIPRSPNSFEPLATLGYVYYLQKQYAKSIDTMEQAKRLNDKVPGIYYYLGLNQLMLGQKDQALKQYQVLKEMKSDFANKLLAEINKH